MLVEFIGAAGAGKSFLSERVIDELQSRGLVARNFDLIKIERAAPRNLALLAKAIYLAAIMRPKKPALMAQTIGDIARYSIRREICRQVEGIHITSEGLFHRIVGFHRNSGALAMTQLAGMLFSKIQPPAVVVVVEASAEKVFARRTARNRANDIFSLESVGADIAIVRECVATMEYVQRTLSSQMRILRLDANEEGGAGAVANIIAELERNAGTPAAPVLGA